MPRTTKHPTAPRRRVHRKFNEKSFILLCFLLLLENHPCIGRAAEAAADPVLGLAQRRQPALGIDRVGDVRADRHSHQVD